MPDPKTILLAACPLALAAAVLLSPQHTARCPAPLPDTGIPATAGEVPAAAEPVAVLTVAAEAAEAACAPDVEVVLFPDGSRLPALNGTIGAPPVRWSGAEPYSPVVGSERDSRGVDWYVHRDGTRSTTQMIWRSDLGRRVGMTLCAHPIDAPAGGGDGATGG